jgi:hypothetical protein
MRVLAVKLIHLIDIEWTHWLYVLNSIQARRNLATYVEMGCPEIQNGEIVNQELSRFEEVAKFVLGKDYLSLEDVEKAHSFTYTQEQKKALAETVPGMWALIRMSQLGFFLTPTLLEDNTLIQVCNLQNPGDYPKIKRMFSNALMRCSSEEVVPSCQWLVVGKQPYPCSVENVLNEHQKLISPAEYVPNAAELVFAVTTYYLVRSIKLLKDVSVRTSSVDSCGQRLVVGYTQDSLQVSESWDTFRNPYIGVSFAMKPLPDLEDT